MVNEVLKMPRLSLQISYLGFVQGLLPSLAHIALKLHGSKAAQQKHIDSATAKHVTAAIEASHSLHEFSERSAELDSAFHALDSTSKNTATVLDSSLKVTLDVKSSLASSAAVMEHGKSFWSSDVQRLTKLAQNAMPNVHLDFNKEDMLGDLDTLTIMCTNRSHSTMVQANDLLTSMCGTFKNITRDTSGPFIEHDIIKDANETIKFATSIAVNAYAIFMCMQELPKIVSPAQRKVDSKKVWQEPMGGDKPDSKKKERNRRGQADHQRMGGGPHGRSTRCDYGRPSHRTPYAEAWVTTVGQCATATNKIVE